MTEVYLLEDVYSNFKNAKPEPYGKKGDKVKLISVKGDVLLVEGKDNQRFSVRKELTTIK